jgi:hypothetical protein
MMYCTGLSLTGLAVCGPSQTGAITQLVLSASTVAENGSGGEFVGTLSIVGPGFTGPVTYSITSDPSLKLEIAGAGLDELRVKAATTIDFETNPSFSVDLQGVDSTVGTPKTFAKSAVITITDVNEAPTNIDLSGTTVVDTAADGTVIGVLSNPLDPDAGDTFTWAIAPGGDPSGNFEVVETDFRVKTGNTLDNSVDASHSVTFRVTDAGGLTFDKAFTITVTAGATSFQHTDTIALSGLFNAYPANHVDTGTDIDVWTDLSTKAPANFSQSVTANKLQYVVDGMGAGLPGAQLKIQSVMSRASQTVRCIAMAGKFVLPLASRNFILLNFSTSPASGEVFFRNNGNNNPLSFDGGNSATARYALNNDPLSAFTAGFNTPFSPTALPPLGDKFVLWVEFAADQTFDTAFDRIPTLDRSGGMIGELLYFDAVPAEADRIKHRDKLIADWNVTP